MSGPAVRQWLYDVLAAIPDPKLTVYRTPEKLTTTADLAMLRSMESVETRFSQQTKRIDRIVSVLVMLEDAEAEDAVDRREQIVQEITVACRQAPRNALITGPDGEMSRVLFAGERIVQRPATEADMGMDPGDEGMFLAAQVMEITIVEETLG